MVWIKLQFEQMIAILMDLLDVETDRQWHLKSYSNLDFFMLRKGNSKMEKSISAWIGESIGAKIIKKPGKSAGQKVASGGSFRTRRTPQNPEISEPDPESGESLISGTHSVSVFLI